MTSKDFSSLDLEQMKKIESRTRVPGIALAIWLILTVLTMVVTLVLLQVKIPWTWVTAVALGLELIGFYFLY
ncbi:MAG: hypothetical protein PVF18_05155, partial [Anaerolineales bacterium]